jgi:hypothetical protein
MDTLRLMKFGALSPKQKSELKKKFHERKRDLEAAVRAGDGGLEELAAEKPKPKRTALRRALYKK